MITKEVIAREMIEKRFFKSVINWMDKHVSTIFIRFIQCRIQIENKKIIFLTFRNDYDCNAKWICEEILRQKLPYQLVWAIRKGTKTGPDYFPAELKLVRKESYEYYKELSSARIIIDNGISMVHSRYRKKKGQILIETWHGSLGIKKFSQDTVNDKEWVKKALKEGKATDYIISNSDFEDAIYREDYWKKTPIWKLGHARNDILFNNDQENKKRIKEKIFKKYNIWNNDKLLDNYDLFEGYNILREDILRDYYICLYAPTFREKLDITSFNLDFEMLRNTLKQKFGGKWIIFVRFHFRIINKMKNFLDELPVVNVSSYPDIQELLLCTDVGITDYSSWICDFLLTKRPGFLIAKDLDSYQEEERDFAYPLSELPFSLAQNDDELRKNILEFNEDDFVRECNRFLNSKGCVENGTASKQIVNRIKKIIMQGERKNVSF